MLDHRFNDGARSTHTRCDAARRTRSTHGTPRNATEDTTFRNVRQLQGVAHFMRAVSYPWQEGISADVDLGLCLALFALGEPYTLELNLTLGPRCYNLCVISCTMLSA